VPDSRALGRNGDSPSTGNGDCTDGAGSFRPRVRTRKPGPPVDDPKGLCPFANPPLRGAVAPFDRRRRSRGQCPQPGRGVSKGAPRPFANPPPTECRTVRRAGSIIFFLPSIPIPHSETAWGRLRAANWPSLRSKIFLR
jgi:hypothetical protein